LGRFDHGGSHRAREINRPRQDHAGLVQSGEPRSSERINGGCGVRNLKTVRYVVEDDDSVLHIASERQLQLAMPTRTPNAT
jgi:hypothetical protein